MSLRIAVMGGAGYVGTELCRELKRRGHDVTVVARATGRLLLDRFDIPVLTPDDRLSQFDVVVNLAYPSLANPETVVDQNRTLAETMERLSSASTTVIHTSTMAVFGYALEYPLTVGPVRPHRDYLYVEAKLDMESLLRRRRIGRGLHIVRLGNVWGPGSPYWTAALADRLVFGEAVGVVDQDGYCNATDVRNVASYLTFLAEQGGAEREQYHHLAEFSGLRWSYWIDRLSRFFGIPPVLAHRRGAYPTGWRAELGPVLANYSPFTLSRQLRSGRFTGSIRRSAPLRLANRLVRRFRPLGARVEGWVPPDPPIDPTFLEVMSASRRFESHVHDGWTPPVDVDASWQAVETWLVRAGYP